MVNKKVLMFGPLFFGYRESIADELRTQGAQVDLYDERPNNSAFCKVMLRYNVRLYDSVVMKYYQSIVDANKDKDYDYVFVIKSEAINEKVFAMLKNAYPNAKFILYLWDSVENVPDGEKKIRLYDRVLTFDHEDAKRYGLILRPLFFGKNYEPSAAANTDYKYDIAFIGTAHSVRPYVVDRIVSDCGENRTCFYYLFLPHKIVYWYNKLLNGYYRNVRMSDIHFTPMNPAQVRSVYDRSRCVLDVEHNAQRGLTMRTIEMVGMGKKLITTNSGIVKYDFYNPENICVIDRNDPKVPDAFLDSGYTPIPNKIMNRYSLHSFVCDILDIKEQEHE